MRNDHELAAYIGLDWGDQRHAVQMQPAAGGPVERLELDQRPDVLHAWVAQLRQRFHGRPVGIALEQRKGAVIYALMMYEFLVLYPVNPKAVARYREVFAPSGAKDDPTDAALLLDLLCTHRDTLRAWTPDTVAARTLGLLCEQRRKLVQHRVAVTNRLISVLTQYFPQALDWVGTLASRQGCDFLRTWSTLAAIQRARPATVRRFYHRHNCRRAAVVARRLEQIATAVPLTTDPAIIAPLRLVVQTYATQLRSLLEAVEAFDDQIAAVFAAHPDHDLFASFPARGRSVPRGWRPPSAPTARAGRRRPSSRPTRASRPSPNAAGRPAGSITAWPVPSFSSKPSTNTRTSRFASLRGRGRITTSSVAAAMTITPRCGRSPSNGCEFSFGAGRLGRRTTRPPTSTCSVGGGQRSSKILLDCTTQMSMPPAPMGARISYGPRVVPGSRGMATGQGRAP